MEYSVILMKSGWNMEDKRDTMLYGLHYDEILQTNLIGDMRVIIFHLYFCLFTSILVYLMISMFVIFYYSSAAWKFVEEHMGIDYGWEVVLTGNNNTNYKHKFYFCPWHNEIN